MKDDDNGGAAPSSDGNKRTLAAPSFVADAKSGSNTGATAPAASGGIEAAAASPDMHQLIGRQLRAVYDDVARQPSPDRFIELVQQLDRKAQAR